MLIGRSREAQLELPEVTVLQSNHPNSDDNVFIQNIASNVFKDEVYAARWTDWPNKDLSGLIPRELCESEFGYVIVKDYITSVWNNS